MQTNSKIFLQKIKTGSEKWVLQNYYDWETWLHCLVPETKRASSMRRLYVHQIVKLRALLVRGYIMVLRRWFTDYVGKNYQILRCFSEFCVKRISIEYLKRLWLVKVTLTSNTSTYALRWFLSLFGFSVNSGDLLLLVFVRRRASCIVRRGSCVNNWTY